MLNRTTLTLKTEDTMTANTRGIAAAMSITTINTTTKALQDSMGMKL